MIKLYDYIQIQNIHTYIFTFKTNDILKKKNLKTRQTNYYLLNTQKYVIEKNL